jgi:hypothetical protein
MPAWVKNLVPPPVGKNETIKTGSEDVERDTMPLIINKIYRTLYHTEKLATKLKGSSLTDTCRKDWQFIFDHVRYRKDAANSEQVRSPRRLIYDGKGDCDCFTVTLSSLLINQGIPHYLRIMSEEGGNAWGHIYIVVPKSGKLTKTGPEKRSDYIVMDCVTHKFDFEAPFETKKDFPMSLQYLDGLSSSRKGKGRLNGTCESKPYPARVRKFVYTRDVLADGYVPTEYFLKQNNIAYQPYVDPKTEGGVFIVTTSSGTKQVPPILTKQQASDLLANASIAAPAPTALTTTATDSVVSDPSTQTNQQPKKTNNLLWYLLIGGAILLLASESKGGGGVNINLGDVKTKSKSKRKIKTLSI